MTLLGTLLLGAGIGVCLVAAALDWIGVGPARPRRRGRTTDAGLEAPVFEYLWSGTLAIEGRRLADGRMLDPGSLNWDVPIPLFSPADDRVIGRAVRVWRDDARIRAQGYSETMIPSQPLVIDVDIERFRIEGPDGELAKDPIPALFGTGDATLRIERARLRRVSLSPVSAFLEARVDGAPVLFDDRRIIGRVISVDETAGVLTAELEIDDPAVAEGLVWDALRGISVADPASASPLRRAIARILRR